MSTLFNYYGIKKVLYGMLEFIKKQLDVSPQAVELSFMVVISIL